MSDAVSAAGRIAGAIVAVVLTIDAVRGHTDGHLTTPQLVVVLVITSSIATLVWGIGRVERHHTRPKEPL